MLLGGTNTLQHHSLRSGVLPSYTRRTHFSLLPNIAADTGSPAEPTVAMMPQSNMEVLSQVIDDENGHYRLRIGRRVHYLTISSGVFDDDTICRPYLLIPKLAHLPDSPWTTMTISHDENGSLTFSTFTDPVQGLVPQASIR